MAGKRIGLVDVRKLAPGEILWDSIVPGFGVRRQESQAISYVLKYRTAENRQRWLTIGRHGAPWTPDTAREEAKRLLGDVARGADPAADKKSKRHAKTVSELCDEYMADAEAGRLLTRRQMAKTASTIATDRGRIESHIKPLLGLKPISSVTREDVEAFMHDIAAGKTARNSKTKKRKITKVRGGKGAAARTIGLLGAIFSYAVRRRIRHDNPVRGVVRFADGKRERRLRDVEFAALGEGLRVALAEGLWPPAVEVARFLALTGWRSGEALSLRWEEIDLPRRTATLVNTKTGHSIRPLSQAACAVLRKFSRSKGVVFQAVGEDSQISGYRRHWARVTSLGKLSADVTPHTLRHSFASLAGDMGYAETTIAAMLGHKGRSITSRYVHAADAVLLAAADAVGARVAQLMDNQSGKPLELTGLSESPTVENTVLKFRRSV